MSEPPIINKRLRSDSVKKIKERKRVAFLVHEKLLLRREVNKLKKQNKRLEENFQIPIPSTSNLPRISTPKPHRSNHTEFWSFSESQDINLTSIPILHQNQDSLDFSLESSEIEEFNSIRMDNIKKQLSKSITKFDGEFVNYQQFIDNVKSAIDSLANPDDIPKLLQFVIQTCTTPSCYNKLSDVVADDFEDFKKKLDNVLFANITSSSLKSKLESSKQQQNESINDFVNKFRSTLLNLKSKMPEDISKSDFFKNDIKKTLIRNLLPKYQTIALIHQSQSIEQMFQELLINSDITADNSLENKIDQLLVLSTNKPNKNYRRNNYNPFNRSPRNDQFHNQRYSNNSRNYPSNNYNYSQNTYPSRNNHGNMQNSYPSRNNNYQYNRSQNNYQNNRYPSNMQHSPKQQYNHNKPNFQNSYNQNDRNQYSNNRYNNNKNLKATCHYTNEVQENEQNFPMDISQNPKI